MLGTLVRRVTIKTLDLVVDQGTQSRRAPVRTAARVLDRARGVVGLATIARRFETPAWDGTRPEQHMWGTDEQKLRKHQLDHGIIKEEDAPAETVAADESADAGHAVKVYFKRGCPYTRAAIDLLREREIPFDEQDVTMDEPTRGWLKIITGQGTTPQIFIHGEPIGGYDQLRGLDLDGTLRERVAGDDAVAATSEAADDEPEPIPEMSVEMLAERIDEGGQVLLLDVRKDAEVKTGVLAHAVHIPLDQLDARFDELDPEGVWIVYCLSGKRSLTATSKLLGHGFRTVVSLTGGIQKWRGNGGAIAGFGDTAPRKTPVRTRLTVLNHPERSPFEDLSDSFAATDDAARLEGDALVERVREVLEECRPMVVADGGDINLLDVADDVVHLELTGNCVGCPSAQATLKQGIERRLVSRIPQLKGLQSPQLM